MAKINDKGLTNIRELSRSMNCKAHYTIGQDGTKEYPSLYESISAGALQRIADSMESISNTLKSIDNKTPTNYHRSKVRELKLEVEKLWLKLIGQNAKT